MFRVRITKLRRFRVRVRVRITRLRRIRTIRFLKSKATDVIEARITIGYPSYGSNA